MSRRQAATIECLQERILEAAGPLAPEVRAAFRAVPRHAYVPHFLSGGRQVAITPENLDAHLPLLYHNGTLLLWQDEARGLCSTISQPTLVLLMLQQLALRPGLTVFEVGAGSGWNAALLGHLVGPAGRVYSSEIVPEMAALARASIAAQGVANVTILSGDGAEGFPPAAPFDRVVFTAGTYDLPAVFHDQVRAGGLLQLVLKMRGGGDLLYLLERTADGFEADRGMPCAFVPMLGQYDSSSGPGAALADLPAAAELSAMRLRIYPARARVAPQAGEWLVRQRGSQFLWGVK